MNPTLVVLKFGSSVLSNRDCLPAVVHDIYRYYRRGHRVLVVVSAIGRHTDLLLDEAKSWMNPPAPDAAVAELLATGERQSAALVTMALHRAGLEAMLLTPSAIKLTLSGDRLDSSPASVDVEAIRRSLESSPVLVVPGFSGVHEEGGTALMGRGGSDLTAVFLAHVLQAERCRLVKDVDGIYERDPAADAPTRSAKRPHRYGCVTYDEALRVSGELVQPKALEYLRGQKSSARVTGLLLEDGTDIGAESTSFRDRPATPPLRVLLLGPGSVGRCVCRHVLQLGSFFEITGIYVRDEHEKRNLGVDAELLSTDLGELMSRPYDAVVDVSGDVATASAVIEACRRSGRPVVTAGNPIFAARGSALRSRAAGSAGCWPTAETVVADLIEIHARRNADGSDATVQGRRQPESYTTQHLQRRKGEAA